MKNRDWIETHAEWGMWITFVVGLGTYGWLAYMLWLAATGQPRP